ncbi:polysaccharide biosynthesis protein, partial [Enterococcus faecium]|uniref:polysaccharide biosynthesis protein n=1 Tax=Enterococcus faecium TaxID=1352 RepID=UPI003F425910
MGKEVLILDLAKKMIKLSGFTEKEIPIVESGIRPGEKLYEELLLTDETTGEKVDDKIFVGKITSQPIEEIYEFVESLDLTAVND